MSGSPPPEQPTLSDGVVTLRPWRDADVTPAVDGHDELVTRWLGRSRPPTYAEMRDLLVRRRAEGARVGLVVERDELAVGAVELRRAADGVCVLSWWLFAGHRGRGSATRAVRLLAQYAVDGLGVRRVEAEVDPQNEPALRVATRAGLRREGIRRYVPGMADRPEATGAVVLARLATDPPISEPEGFRALLNSFLPRKRAIAQLLVRDPDDRVLLCELTYKTDWDLPGGVVEVGESPRLAVARELSEELALTVAPGRLLLTDWLPPWGGWDDALCLVFDGGVHDPGLLAGVVAQRREIRSVAFCSGDELAARCADFTTRRILAALANLGGLGGPDGPDGPGGPAYVESGR